MWNAGQNNSNKLAIPAQGIADIRNSLSEILDEFGMDEGNASYYYLIYSIYCKKTAENLIYHCFAQRA